jgi:hypothetical protein
MDAYYILVTQGSTSYVSHYAINRIIIDSLPIAHSFEENFMLCNSKAAAGDILTDRGIRARQKLELTTYYITREYFKSSKPYQRCELLYNRIHYRIFFVSASDSEFDDLVWISGKVCKV